MTKPIEPGCRAIIRVPNNCNSENTNLDGVEVTVLGKFCKAGEFVIVDSNCPEARAGSNVWIVSIKMGWRIRNFHGTLKVISLPYCPEPWLHRIDDDDNDVSWERIKEITNWSPDKIIQLPGVLA